MTTLLLWIGAGLAGLFLLAAAIVFGVVTWYDVRERRARAQLHVHAMRPRAIMDKVQLPTQGGDRA